MSQLIRNSVLSPKVAIREQKTYWSRLYGSAKSLAVIKVAYQIDSPVVLITNNVLSAANLVSELENFSEDLAVVPIKIAKTVISSLIKPQIVMLDLKTAQIILWCFNLTLI